MSFSTQLCCSGKQALCRFLTLALLLSIPAFCVAVAPLDHETAGTAESTSLIGKITAGPAFSFTYDGKRSEDLLPQWQRSETSRSLGNGRELRVTTFRDLATGIEVSREVTAFPDASAVEVMVRVRNTGQQDTRIFQALLPLNLNILPQATGKVVMHHARGSLGNTEDYLPIDAEISKGTEVSLSHYVLERSQQVGGQLPFFNLEWQGGGLIGAVGWTGQWAIHANGENDGSVTLQAGQQDVHLKLHSGESIRTPRILLLEWHGNDRLLGHNQFRRLLLAHYVPKAGGQVVVPPMGNSNAFVYTYETIEKKTGQNPLEVVSRMKPGEEKQYSGAVDEALNWVNEKNQLDFIRGMPPVGIELYWLDAGWFEGEWPFGVGTWNPDPKKFPRGLKPISDAAHERGMKFLLWFEPGRVGSTSTLNNQHPDWVLHREGEGKVGGLFNFGDPVALRWMTETLSQRIKDWGVDIYRQDSNICPLPFWRTADDADRQGMTEIRWVEGLYALWDSLLREHPGLMIDNANWRVTGPDIEVMSRSVGSLTRSETECGGMPHPAATQVQTAQLNLWIPVHMGAVNGFDPYVFRSAATNGTGTGLDLRAPYVPLEQVKSGIDEMKSLRPFWQGDYYPLTGITIDERDWMAWQFHRADLGAGFAVFFRRPLNQQPALDSALRGLDASASYEVTFAKTYEVEETKTMTGQQLMRLRVEIGATPGSLLVRYRRTQVAKN